MTNANKNIDPPAVQAALDVREAIQRFADFYGFTFDEAVTVLYHGHQEFVAKLESEGN